MKAKRFFAWVLTLTMVVSLLSGIGISVSAADATQSDTKENTNQASGIIYTKTSTAKSDGTIDITLTAHTTGEVKQENAVSPTDIVLVLDVSGSMADNYTTSTITGHNAVNGSKYTYTEWVIIFPVERTGYGFNNSGKDFYINTGTASKPVYTYVNYTGKDANEFEIYEYMKGSTAVKVYPALEGNITASREFDYPVVQFYEPTIETGQSVNKMTSLKNAVNTFINTTLQMNEGLEKDQMHTISIVKFASDDYYNSDVVSIVEGDNKGAGGDNDYNYSQVVKNLTTVDNAGATALKNSVNALTPGGATAVDYGLELAEAVLMNRSQIVDTGAVDRNEVVIVFTDGDPNHGNGFDDDVANASIALAKDMKSVGTKIYSICIADGANVDKVNDGGINQFMHAISSNYPSAASMSSMGEPTENFHYYMKPDDTSSLSMLFNKIALEIDRPTIEMGADATLVDTLSPYFSFENGNATNVNLKTNARVSDGNGGLKWSDTYEDDASLDYVITDDRLTVTGFDFDANYVSEEGRGANNDFYGKRLIISFTVVPDYGVIDAASASFMDGILPTNEGFATINDSDENPEAEVETPQLKAHAVTYMVDGEEYTEYNRFTGSDVAVIKEPEKTGYTFSGWTTADVTVNNNEFTMPDKDVTLVGTFTANTHKVNYVYSGTVIPNDATDLSGANYNGNSANASVAYGTTVTVAPDATATGYTFSGWYPQQTDVDITDGKFTMPDKDVTLIGYFSLADNTQYRVLHFLMDKDGNYPETPYETEISYGTTNDKVIVYPDTTFEAMGYSYELTYSLGANNNLSTDLAVSGTIQADGSLALKLYYSRMKYNVLYQLAREENLSEKALLIAKGLIPTDNKKYRHGETAEVKPDIAIPGYSFHTWHDHSTVGAISIANGKFEMPVRDVTLYGYFTANADTPYKIEHYVEKADGDGYETSPHTTRTATGITDAKITADPLLELTSAGYKYNLAYSLTANGNDANDEKVSGIITADDPNTNDDETLVLKLYYDRVKYNVEYKFEGNLPDGISQSDVPTQEPVPFGDTVTVKDLEASVPAGYEFKGWYRGAYLPENMLNDSFTMPAHDVTILGHFEPMGGVEYRVENYLMDENGEYPDTPHVTETYVGTQDERVTAVYIPSLLNEGYEKDTDKEDDITGIVKADDPNTTEDETLVLKLYYKRTTYGVTYELERLDTLPTAVKTVAESLVPTDNNKYRHGATVSVSEDDMSIEGYTFRVWHAHSTDGALDIVDGKFTMPTRDVKLYGYYTANTDTQYTIEHYVEKADGDGYEATPHTTRTATGTTDAKITADPIPEITSAGFKYNLEKSLDANGNPSTDAKVSGIVKADGGLVLKLYYDREEYEVEYKLEGVIPTGVDANNVPAKEKVAHGDTVSVKPLTIPPADYNGYTFIGWYRGTDATPAGNSFAMPAHNVILLGRFVPDTDTPYHVKHYLRKLNADGTAISNTGDKAQDYELDMATVDTRFGTTDQDVSALPREFTGFEYNASISTATGKIKGDGSLSLEFYYERIPYDISYAIEGKKPDESIHAPNGATAPYGAKVTVEATPNVPGFKFNGWNTTDATVENGVFIMPNKDVALKGSFESTIVDYKVNYYFQKVDAGNTFNKADYELSDKSYTRQAYVGQHVEADKIDHTGFFVHPDPAVVKSYGHVTVDDSGKGNLVLNIYYDRHTYDVIYEYYGQQPTGAPDISGLKKEDVRYGEVVELENKPALADYTFDGWYTHTIHVEDGKFTMPAHDVTLLGRFVDKFRVSYDLKGGTGAEGIDYGTKAVDAGSDIIVKEAPHRSGYLFTGWQEGPDTFSAGDTVTVERNYLFIAQWKRTGGGGGGGGGGGSTKYTLSYETNGGTTFVDEEYSYGTVVELNKKPRKEGYIFDGWHIDSTLSSDVDEVKMTKNITVYADWVEDNGTAGDGYKTPDSLNGDDHFAYVIGYTDGTVRPEANILRSEVTAIFFRLLTEDVRNANLSESNSYNDIRSTDWHNTAISTLTALGIVNGKNGNMFDPNAYITRGEFAAICARFDDSEFEIVDNFTDVKGHWAENEIHEAAAHGWIRGYTDGTFKPDQLISRAEAMTMINRVLNRVPQTKEDLLPNMINWPDNSNTSKWYYLPVQEATNGHEFEMKNHIYEKWTSLKESTDWTQYQ